MITLFQKMILIDITLPIKYRLASSPMHLDNVIDLCHKGYLEEDEERDDISRFTITKKGQEVVDKLNNI